MPYAIRKSGSQFCVVKKSDGKRIGCHPSRKKARSQLAALYANEPTARAAGGPGSGPHAKAADAHEAASVAHEAAYKSPGGENTAKAVAASAKANAASDKALANLKKQFGAKNAPVSALSAAEYHNGKSKNNAKEAKTDPHAFDSHAHNMAAYNHAEAAKAHRIVSTSSKLKSLSTPERSAMDLRALHLRIAASKEPLRVEQFEGRTYHVLPAVALVEGVIKALGAKNPEFVRAEKFSIAPSGWNGRPIVLNHPMEDGTPISANDPDVLRTAVGKVFNTNVKGKKLTTELWIDVDKGASVLERYASGEPIEISTGAFVSLKNAAGQHNGRSYKGEWDMIVPDHIAILDPGHVGACSVAMGCGVRAATYNDDGEEIGGGLKTKIRDKLSKMAGALKSLAAGEDPPDDDEEEESLSDVDDDDDEEDDEDAEDVLYSSMKSFFAQADTALADAKKLVDDLINSNGANDDEEVEEARLQAVQSSSYLVSDILMRVSDLTRRLLVKANDRITKVQVVGSVPYALRAAKGAEFSKKNSAMIQTIHDHTTKMGAACSGARAAETPCGCGNKPAGTTADAGGSEMGKKRSERIAALVACEHNPLKDPKILNEMNDTELDALEAHTQTAVSLKAAASKDAAAANDVIKNLVSAHGAAKDHADKLTADEKAKAEKEKGKADDKGGDMKAAVDAAVAAAMPKTEEEFLKIAPESIRTLVADTKARDTAIRTRLVAQLKAAQKVYTEDELKAMDTKGLIKLASLTKGETVEDVDFSGMGAPRILEDGEKDYMSEPPPDGYALALQKNKGGKEKVN